MGQSHNKNRPYKGVAARVATTYAKDSQASNKNALADVYVKFWRWATDRLHGADGIVCFVTNNSFVDQIAFDGMRKHLLQDFTHIYHLDLHGNVRKNPKLSGTTHNVFGIQVGVGITVAIRSSRHQERRLFYYRVPEDWRRAQKLAFLVEKGSVAAIEWQELEPDEKNTWLTEGMRPEFATYLPMGTREARAVSSQTVEVPAIFHNYSGGVKTNRDDWVYDFDQDRLIAKVRRLVDTYNGELDRWRRRGSSTTSMDDFVTYDDTRIKWSRDLKLDLRRDHEARFDIAKVRRALYRPFCHQWLFFDRILNEEVYQQPQFFPTGASESENAAICLTDIGSEKPFMTLMTSTIADLHLVGAGASTECFPLYTYTEDGSGRQENITDWALAQFRAQYGSAVTRRDIFDYICAILHHPQYRTLYAENLKRQLPRIPLLPDRAAFEACVRIGADLAKLHTDYEKAQEYPLEWTETAGGYPNWRVEKMRLSPDRSAVIVNDWLTLRGIPPACFEYRLGNRSALDWMLDQYQYQVSTDSRSGIVSDPNRPDDPQYIPRLVARVVTVSVETVRLLAELAQAVSLLEPIDGTPELMAAHMRAERVQ